MWRTTFSRMDLSIFIHWEKLRCFPLPTCSLTFFPHSCTIGNCGYTILWEIFYEAWLLFCVLWHAPKVEVKGYYVMRIFPVAGNRIYQMPKSTLSNQQLAREHSLPKISKFQWTLVYSKFNWWLNFYRRKSNFGIKLEIHL